MLLKSYGYFTAVIILLGYTLAYAKGANRAYTESIAVNLKITGDVIGEYSFAGPVNSIIEATSDDNNSKCVASVLFRKVLSKQKKNIEMWITLNCLFEGQKVQYRLPRYFLELDSEVKKIKIPQLDKNVRQMELEFRDLSLQKGK